MNPKMAVTNESLNRPKYAPEVGNMAGIFGLTFPGAAYGIITEVDDHFGFIGQYAIKVAWFGQKASRKRAHQEAQRSNAARRVAVIDRMDAIAMHYNNGIGGSGDPADYDLVAHHHGCPKCYERRMDHLAIDDDESVTCASCGHNYRLPQPPHFCHCGQPLDDGACECGHCAAEWNEYLAERGEVLETLI